MEKKEKVFKGVAMSTDLKERHEVVLEASVENLAAFFLLYRGYEKCIQHMDRSYVNIDNELKTMINKLVEHHSNNNTYPKYQFIRETQLS